MKIFEFRFKDGEKTWMCANTIIEALQEHASICGMQLWDFDAADDVVEIPKEKWDEMFITDEKDAVISSFAKYMETAIRADAIACTIW